MSSRKVKVIIGILAVVVLVMLAAAHSRKSNYSIVIPKVLTYPTTTLTFASKPAIVGAPSVEADRVQPLSRPGDRAREAQKSEKHQAAGLHDVHIERQILAPVVEIAQVYLLDRSPLL